MNIMIKVKHQPSLNSSIKIQRINRRIILNPFVNVLKNSRKLISLKIHQVGFYACYPIFRSTSTNMESTDNTQSRPCSVCKTFFATSATNFMCSKCFKQAGGSIQPKDSSMTSSGPSQSTEAKGTVPPSDVSQPQANGVIESLPATSEFKGAAEESKEPAAAISAPVETVPEKVVQTNKSLCWECKKKVGLLGFHCKCDFTFCGKHRYAEEHRCQFDYMQQQQARLAKENPLIAHQKVSKI